MDLDPSFSSTAPFFRTPGEVSSALQGASFSTGTRLQDCFLPYEDPHGLLNLAHSLHRSSLFWICAIRGILRTSTILQNDMFSLGRRAVICFGLQYY
nr:uncharacterized protein LOC112997453 isoform X8 [Dromaius novaehollandiae]